LLPRKKSFPEIGKDADLTVVNMVLSDTLHI